ncbi:Boron transporter 1 [Komagataella phaffii CBS 7435]|uniref:Boron efflux transporter of the plasma membrane n=2 Tax=Komagataella phaffii TaxID=460519 RepID=C4R2T7_KOMPG|nr:Boron efflux transporter of the plasma membrane [Komagataella phaffii GS115]AOA62212.1 GQ67_01231T0 [Komagataella phaffii]CAH2447633.1 Boron transporter 1 [Komagataella phaffii CBS 7435]AOA67132.1 GQ68_00159T0 [Komagataella phaffii GS115]CAY69811.1 Boron efflux transporter of the plasma membrane [Komagataella phaffii GS115]SCV11973.1 Boron transporter 1 [Komagataella phaffii CBS 7435]
MSNLPKVKIREKFHYKRIGQGIITDIRNRLPYLRSDYSDAINYRVIPSTVYIFFTNLLPAIAFAQDMFDHTDNSYGLNEVLMSSAMGGIVFGLFSGQPLCIVGVTGPIAIFNFTVYDLIKDRDVDYFSFMCWVCLWSTLMHFILAIFNTVNYIRYITMYSCDVFGFFINCIYIQKGIQILTRQFADGDYAKGFASVMVALLMCIFGLASVFFGTDSHYIKPVVRKIFSDYGLPLSVVFFSGFIHFGGYLNNIDFETLPISQSFRPTFEGRRSDWFIRFWEGCTVGDVFLALPFALLLTFLFYFDHNVSSLMCQAHQFPVTKPSSFHWDYFLLGITTGVSGILGIPAPNGLIPQAPLHSSSLCIKTHDYESGVDIVTGMVEQRVTNIAQGLLTLGMMARPLLIVLGNVPQSVLAGLFWIMGLSGLNGNEVTNKLRFLFTDPETIRLNPTEYQAKLSKIERKWLILFVIFELIAFACEFGITCTRGAIGFPGVLMFFAIFATFFDRIFPPDQLEMLDTHAASAFILQNLHRETKI